MKLLALLLTLALSSALISAQQITFGSSQHKLRRQSAEYFLTIQVDLEQQLPGYIVEYAVSVSNTSFATAWTSLSEYQQIHNVTVYFNYSLPVNVDIYAVLRTRQQGNIINWRYAYSESLRVGDKLPSDAPCDEVWVPTSGLISPPKTPTLQVYFESHSGIVIFQLTAQYLLGGYTWVIDFQPFMNNVTAGQGGLGVTSCENRDGSALTATNFVEWWNSAPAANYSEAMNSPEYMSYYPGPSSPWTLEAITCGSVRYTMTSPFARVSTCQTASGSPAVSYVDLTTGDVLFYGTLYVTAVRPISVLDESRGYQSYASSIPFQWTYNVTKVVTPVINTPVTVMTPVNNNNNTAGIIAPELLPAIIIPAVVGGVVLTLGIVVGVMARHKSTRGAVKNLFHRKNCSGAREPKKKADDAKNGNAPDPVEAVQPAEVDASHNDQPSHLSPSNSAVVVAEQNPPSEPNHPENAPPLSIPKIAIGEILEMVNRNLDFAAQTAGTESEEEMEGSGTLDHSETRDLPRSDSPVQHSPAQPSPLEKELISNDLVTSRKHSPQRTTFATPVASPKLKLSRIGNEGLRLSSVNSPAQNTLRSSSDMSARRESDSPKSVLWNSRNSSLANSRQNSRKHLPRKDSNVLLSGVSEQLLEVKFNVFGRQLSEVVDKNKQLPILLEELTEGLLKAAAQLSQLELRQVLCKCLERVDVEVRAVKRDISLCDFDQLSANIPVALTLLFDYFADLPSALVPVAILTDMLEAMKLDSVPDFQFELQRCSVLSLPHAHFRVLARMSEFIHRLTALLDDDTRQTVFSKACYRFGLCFIQHASCLKSSAVIDGNEKISKQVASTCQVFEYIVAHRERLFNLQLTPEQTFTQKDEALYLDTTSRDLLFKLMINPHYKEPDFLEVLAFGAAYVLSATNWFTQLIDCYNALGDTIAAFQVPIKLRILNIFEAWLKLNKRTLVAEREAVKVLCKFLQHETNSSPHVQVLVSSLNVLMLTQIKVVPLPSSSVPLLVPNLREDFSIYNFSTKEVARELCLIDWSLFKEVDPTECGHKRFMEARTGGYFFKAAERFNNINAWVQYEVLRLTAVKDRVTFMTFLAEVATECLSMNNFSAALAIFCAFNATPIMRLKDTWQKLSLHSKKQLRQLAYVFSMDSNYKVYRKTLASATPPIIPYLGLYGKYLFSIEENVESLTDDGLVNMDKLYKLYHIVKEIRSYQQTGYDFKSNNDLNRYLLNMVTLTEKEAFEQSLKLEP